MIFHVKISTYFDFDLKIQTNFEIFLNHFSHPYFPQLFLIIFNCTPNYCHFNNRIKLFFFIPDPIEQQEEQVPEEQVEPEVPVKVLEMPPEIPPEPEISTEIPIQEENPQLPIGNDQLFIHLSTILFSFNFD